MQSEFIVLLWRELVNTGVQGNDSIQSGGGERGGKVTK